MQIKIKRLHKTVDLPKYQTKHSSAMDAHAAIDEPFTLKPLERKLIPLGFSAELPEGYEVQVRARSGLALKYGITMANGIGTIDADYRGEYGAIVINLGSEPYTINPNDRIAQLVLAKYQKAVITEADELSITERGEGGFGSTGV